MFTELDYFLMEMQDFFLFSELNHIMKRKKGRNPLVYFSTCGKIANFVENVKSLQYWKTNETNKKVIF